MQTDEELVRCHLLGDEAAFPQLVHRYIRPLYNLAQRSTGNAMEAENIVQETFTRACVALSRGHAPDAFRPWLFTIAVNLCRNRARRARREALASPHASAEEPGSALERLPDPTPGPLEALLAAEDREALERAVAALPLPYREAVILRYVEGLSYDELAQVLDLPVNTVRSHLHRAKERLRLALRQQVRERDGLPGGAAASGCPA